MVRKLIRASLFAVLAIFALCLLALITSGIGSRETIKILVFGWIDFLERNLPNVTVNWSAILMVLLCSTLFVAGSHWLCKSFYKSVNPETSPTWQWRWTLAIFASLWLTFGIVIGASGAFRHSRWLINSKEPLYKERFNYRVDMRSSAMELKYHLEESKTNIDHVYGEAIMSMARRRWPLGLMERYQYVLLTDSGNNIHSALLIPREPEIQQRFGFISTSDPLNPIPIDQLANYLPSK